MGTDDQYRELLIEERQKRFLEARDLLTDLTSGSQADTVRGVMRDYGFTAQHLLNHGGVNLSPEEADKALLSQFRVAYLNDAQRYAENIDSANTRDSRQLNANLAGVSLGKAGIDADTNDDGKFSTREIKIAIKGLPKLESQPVPKEEESAFKPAPNTQGPIPARDCREGGIG